jgi:hypothetical protein
MPVHRSQSVPGLAATAAAIETIGLSRRLVTLPKEQEFGLADQCAPLGFAHALKAPAKASVIRMDSCEL